MIIIKVREREREREVIGPMENNKKSMGMLVVERDYFCLLSAIPLSMTTEVDKNNDYSQ